MPVNTVPFTKEELISGVSPVLALSRKAGCDMMRNSKWKEYIVLFHQEPFVDGLKMSTNSKCDLLDALNRHWELKSCAIKTSKRKNLDGKYLISGEFQFDKQNDPVRRLETLTPDGFIFALFDAVTPEPIFVLRIEDKLALAKLIALLQKKQVDFVDKWELAQQNNKRIRDNISVTVGELFSNLTEDDMIIYNTIGQVISRTEFINLVHIKPSA